MSKKDDTIENRVYLFESLASSYISVASDQLASEDDAVRLRARRALAELAYLSCVVSDTGHLSAEEVRERVLRGPDARPAPVEKGREADEEPPAKKKRK